MPKTLTDPTTEIAAVRAALVAAHRPGLTFIERIDALEIAVETLLRLAERKAA